MGEEKPISLTQTMVENRHNDILLIVETNGEAIMKNINHVSLPYFHGLTYEDLNTFMIEFFVVYKTYHDASDIQKMKFFMSTLKHEALHWFMILPRDNITS